MRDIADFSEWLRAELLRCGEILECTGSRVYNSSSPPSSPFPYLVFAFVPLQDKFGQARASIQTVLLADLQFYTNHAAAHIASIETAVAVFRERVAGLRGIVFNGTAIALRHDRPIIRSVAGAAHDEKIIVRGSTYKIWLSKC